MIEAENPEIGLSVQAAGIATNYHDHGEGRPVIMIHGSGPGVSAWANWRLNMPVLAQQRRVVALDMVGFGFTERPEGAVYGKRLWLDHLFGLMDTLGIEQADLIGNSFGGGLALAAAVEKPDRFRHLVLMGSVGIDFPITPGLDAVWGYEPSLESMRALLDIFAYNRGLVSDELAQLRYNASIRPGFHESFSAMFPAPRQNGVRDLAVPEDAIANLSHQTLILHGREDKVIPAENGIRLFNLIPNAQLHMFGKCGHWTQIEHAGEFNRLVGEFLSD